jgi:hypothetical protein
LLFSCHASPQAEDLLLLLSLLLPFACLSPPPNGGYEPKNTHVILG